MTPMPHTFSRRDTLKLFGAGAAATGASAAFPPFAAVEDRVAMPPETSDESGHSFWAGDESAADQNVSRFRQQARRIAYGTVFTLLDTSIRLGLESSLSAPPGFRPIESSGGGYGHPRRGFHWVRRGRGCSETSGARTQGSGACARRTSAS